MFQTTGLTREYLKIRDAYTNYLKAYKKMNKGSTEGATTFDAFYLYKTYIVKYMEPHRITAHAYK